MSSFDRQRKGLGANAVAQFHREGYLTGIEIIAPGDVHQLHEGYERLVRLLEPYETPYSIDSWEQHNSWLYQLVTHPSILDVVEDILGPNFFQWGSNIMSKAPHESLHVPFHQDLSDFPLRPPNLVGIWLAFDDTDDSNGCLRVKPGSHLAGLQKHIDEIPEPRNECPSLLTFHLDPRVVDETAIVSLPLRAGQMSILSPLLHHYSEGNQSPRRRCGIQICYAATNVRCVLPKKLKNSDWTDFAGFLCRGKDEYGHFRHLSPPTLFGRGPRKESRELASREDLAKTRPASTSP